MFTGTCEVTLDLAVVVLGVFALFLYFGRLAWGLSLLYFFSMYWVYTIKQEHLVQTFGDHALVWYGAFAVGLLLVVNTIRVMLPDHHQH